MSVEENRNCPCNNNKSSNEYNNVLSDYSNNMMPYNTYNEYAESYKCPVEEAINANDCDLRREMAEQIRCLEFAINECALYLDTHPDDQKCLCLHRKYCKECKELKDKYQKVFGPLTINYPCNKWRWIESPWPWERGNF